ncbi:unnamed protein product, partial [Meganyctiphanes norvegica]
DGIYSRYLPLDAFDLKSGHYELSVSADNNNGISVLPTRSYMPDISNETCCGSEMHFKEVKFTEPFQRREIYGVFNILANASNKDITPPSQILNLRSFMNISTNELTLRWTAPGDDYDWGKADHYEAILSESISQAKALDGERILGMPEPVPSGTEQSVTVLVDRFDQIIYITIHAVDENGNRGRLSNIATMWMPPAPTMVPIPTSTEINIHEEQELTQPMKLNTLLENDWSIIIGSAVGFIFLMIILIIVTVIRLKSQKHYKNKKEEEIKNAQKNIYSNTKPLLVSNQDKIQIINEGIRAYDKPISNTSYIPSESTWGTIICSQDQENHNNSDGKDQTMNHTPDITLTESFSYPSSISTYTDMPPHNSAFIGSDNEYSSMPYYRYTQDSTQFFPRQDHPLSYSNPSASSENMSYLENGRINYDIDIPVNEVSANECSKSVQQLSVHEYNVTATMANGNHKKIQPPVPPKPTIMKHPKQRTITQV